MWRVNLAAGRGASRRARMNHDSRYATAGYPQYSQIESKQVIFAGAPIKRACLRIFIRRWVNNGVSTRSRYTSSRPAGWWHFRIGFLVFSIRFSPLYSPHDKSVPPMFAGPALVIDHRTYIITACDPSSVIPDDRRTVEKQRVVLTYNDSVVAAIKFPG